MLDHIVMSGSSHYRVTHDIDISRKYPITSRMNVDIMKFVHYSTAGESTYTVDFHEHFYFWQASYPLLYFIKNLTSSKIYMLEDLSKFSPPKVL